MKWRKLLASKATPVVILIRFIVGGVFLSEGLQRFIFPVDIGVGRFIKIGIPSPEIMAPFVGMVEIVGGVLLLAGFLTRLAAIPLIINMVVAVTTAKMPILQKSGFWAMAHEARVDYAMLLGCIFLLIAGAGTWSLDAVVTSGTEHSDG